MNIKLVKLELNRNLGFMRAVDKSCSYLIIILQSQALHQYEQERNDELSFRPGDIIRDVQKPQRDWWKGKCLKFMLNKCFTLMTHQ